MQTATRTLYTWSPCRTGQRGFIPLQCLPYGHGSLGWGGGPFVISDLEQFTPEGAIFFIFYILGLFGFGPCDSIFTLCCMFSPRGAHIVGGAYNSKVFNRLWCQFGKLSRHRRDGLVHNCTFWDGVMYSLPGGQLMAGWQGGGVAGKPP